MRRNGTVDDVGTQGGTALVHVGDVGDSTYIESLIAAAVESFGRLDVMHNNAGYGRPDHAGDVTDDGFDEMIRVNLNAVVYGTRAALRVMVEQRGGSIINTASTAGVGAAADRTSYARGEGGRHQPHQEHRGRLREVRHPGERHLSRPDRDAGVRAVRARPRLLQGPGSHAATRSAARTSPRSRCSSRRTSRRSSRATRSSSTAR